MDFVTAFLPDAFPLRAACDIKAIIHRLVCTCGGLIKPPKVKKDEHDEAFDKFFDEDEREERRQKREELKKREKRKKSKKNMRTKIFALKTFLDVDGNKNHKENVMADKKKKEEEHKERTCGEKIKFWIYAKIMATTKDDMKENFDNLLAYIMINVSCRECVWKLLSFLRSYTPPPLYSSFVQLFHRYPLICCSLRVPPPVGNCYEKKPGRGKTMLVYL